MIEKGGLGAFLCLSFWRRVTIIVLLPLLTVPWVGLQCVIVVFPDKNQFFVEKND